MASVAYYCSATAAASSSSNNATVAAVIYPGTSATTTTVTRRVRMRSSGSATALSLWPYPYTIAVHGLRLRSHTPFLSLSSSSFSSIRMVAAAANRNTTNPSSSGGNGQASENKRLQEKEEEEEEVEEDLPWIQEKALDLVEFTGSVTQAIPGPRVGRTSLPWILAIPLTYVGITFVVAFVKTIRKFNSPKEIRRKLVNKNAMLCKSIDELFENGRNGFQPSALKGLMQKTGFSIEEILRKYIRYALNEKAFNPDLVANLIQLRKASPLDDSQVAEILNEISRRIVKDRGPVVMDMSGYTEKGFKRKLAVQALFGKVYYLSELPDFCLKDSSLIVKEIFGVADEDAEKLRLHTLSEAGDVDSLEKMVDGSDSEDFSDASSNAS